MTSRITRNLGRWSGRRAAGECKWRGHRCGVATDGMTRAETLAALPDLELVDLREALEYAAAAVREGELPISATD